MDWMILRKLNWFCAISKKSVRRNVANEGIEMPPPDKIWNFRRLKLVEVARQSTISRAQNANAISAVLTNCQRGRHTLGIFQSVLAVLSRPQA